MNVFLGITGASGAVYACAAAQEIRRQGFDLSISATEAGTLVFELETGAAPPTFAAEIGARYYRHDDLLSPFASGSNPPDCMLVAPCSASTMGSIASGSGHGLIPRAASVCLKERRPLVLLLRESPLSLIHINNMRELTLAGAIIMPASPSFYGKCSTVRDLTDSVAGRALSLAGIPNPLYDRYNQSGSQPGSAFPPV